MSAAIEKWAGWAGSNSAVICISPRPPFTSLDPAAGGERASSRQLPQPARRLLHIIKAFAVTGARRMFSPNDVPKSTSQSVIIRLPQRCAANEGVTTMSLIKDKVDALFRQVLLQPNGLCENPVTRGSFMKGESGEDSIAYQKRAAEKALLAQEWFAFYGPPDAPPLPVTACGWEEMRHEFGLNTLVGSYARSLAIRSWEVHNHPSFEDFARGLMAIDTGLWDLQNRVGPDVLKRYPPRPLVGMTRGTYWAPGKECEGFWAEYRRAERKRAQQAA